MIIININLYCKFIENIVWNFFSSLSILNYLYIGCLSYLRIVFYIFSFHLEIENNVFINYSLIILFVVENLVF